MTLQRTEHPLLSPSLGSDKTLTSFHFGTPGGRPKVAIQASLHAEELPGMLVAHHLRAMLERADAAGQVLGDIVLLPVANPIGLAQRLDHKAMGRFELNTSENFNRHYPDFAKAIWPKIQDQLGDNEAANVATVRAAMLRYLKEWAPNTELQSLRKTLLLLSHDADFMLDLHCDSESVMHFYTEESCWPQLESLTQFLQCEAVLLAKDSGSSPLDECLSGVWWRLNQALQEAGHAVTLPQSCCSCTVELRGEADVSHVLAKADAQAIFAWLQQQGVVRPTDEGVPLAPPALCHATPLAGSETLHARTPGIVVFAAALGQRLTVGDLVAEIINPLTGQSEAVLAGTAGVLYARIRERYVHRGAEVGKIAGAHAFRTGELLGA